MALLFLFWEDKHKQTKPSLTDSSPTGSASCRLSLTFGDGEGYL